MGGGEVGGATRRQCGPQPAQRFSGKRAVGDARIECREPRFAERLFQINFFRIPRGERTPTPNPRAEKGFKTREGTLHQSLRSRLLTGKESFQPPTPFLAPLD